MGITVVIYLTEEAYVAEGILKECKRQQDHTDERSVHIQQAR